MFIDGEIATEFNELVKFGCSAYSPEIELFRAAIQQKTFPAHVHEGFVIGLVLRGIEAFDYRGTRYRAGPGDIILLNPDLLHTAQAGSPGGVEYCTLQIPCALMADHSHPDFYFEEPVFSAPAAASRLFRYFSMMEATQDVLTAQEELDTFLTELLAAIRPAMFGHSAKTSTIDRRMVAVGDLIAASLDTQITVTALADAVGLSRFHFLRVFKKHFGAAPHAYIQALRTANAKRLIAEGVSPTQAAMKTGFVDQSHLTRWMKNCYGVTPGAYQTLVRPR